MIRDSPRIPSNRRRSGGDGQDAGWRRADEDVKSFCDRVSARQRGAFVALHRLVVESNLLMSGCRKREERRAEILDWNVDQLTIRTRSQHDPGNSGDTRHEQGANYSQQRTRTDLPVTPWLSASHARLSIEPPDRSAPPLSMQTPR